MFSFLCMHLFHLSLFLSLYGTNCNFFFPLVFYPTFSNVCFSVSLRICKSVCLCLSPCLSVCLFPHSLSLSASQCLYSLCVSFYKIYVPCLSFPCYVRKLTGVLRNPAKIENKNLLTPLRVKSLFIMFTVR